MTNKYPGLRTAMACALAGLALTSLSNAALALDNPNGIAVDSAGNVYVADAGSVEHGTTGDISIYAIAIKNGTLVATLKGMITSGLSNPYSVAVSAFGTIYAGNLNGGHTISVYGPDFTQTGTISGAGITTYIMDMYVDQDGDLWALDAGGVVHTYLANNTEVSTLSVGGIATAISPWGSNVAVWGRNSTGISVVTANMGEAVNGSGTLNGNIPDNALVPTGVAEDALHQQYATNGSAGQITVFNAALSKVVATFTANGSAIAIDTTHNRIYTTIPPSNEVFVYSLKAPYKFLGSF
jgi:hypothetical protein